MRGCPLCHHHHNDIYRSIYLYINTCSPFGSRLALWLNFVGLAACSNPEPMESDDEVILGPGEPASASDSDDIQLNVAGSVKSKRSSPANVLQTLGMFLTILAHDGSDLIRAYGQQFHHDVATYPAGQAIGVARIRWTLIAAAGASGNIIGLHDIGVLQYTVVEFYPFAYHIPLASLSGMTGVTCLMECRSILEEISMTDSTQSCHGFLAGLGVGTIFWMLITASSVAALMQGAAGLPHCLR